MPTAEQVEGSKWSVPDLVGAVWENARRRRARRWRFGGAAGDGSGSGKQEATVATDHGDQWRNKPQDRSFQGRQHRASRIAHQEQEQEEIDLEICIDLDTSRIQESFSSLTTLSSKWGLSMPDRLFSNTTWNSTLSRLCWGIQLIPARPPLHFASSSSSAPSPEPQIRNIGDAHDQKYNSKQDLPAQEPRVRVSYHSSPPGCKPLPIPMVEWRVEHLHPDKWPESWFNEVCNPVLNLGGRGRLKRDENTGLYVWNTGGTSTPR